MSKTANKAKTSRLWQKIMSVVVSVSMVATMSGMPAYANTNANATRTAQEATAPQKGADNAVTDNAQGDSIQPGADTSDAAKTAANKNSSKPEAKADVKEETKADESYPAYDSSVKVAGKNITVRVSASAGVLPQGTVVEATDVTDSRPDVIDAVEQAVASSEEKVLSDAVAINVVLKNNGKEIQPKDQQKVNVSFYDANVAGEDIDVVYVSDDASKVESVDTVKADANTQTFETSHFSIYVVNGTTNVAKEYTVDSTDSSTRLKLISDVSGANDHKWTVASNTTGSKNGDAIYMEDTDKTTAYATINMYTPAGDYTVTHSYTKKGKAYTETYTIHVINNSETVPVYVYLYTSALSTECLQVLNLNNGVSNSAGYAPVGVFNLSRNYLTSHSNYVSGGALLSGQTDWDSLISNMVGDMVPDGMISVGNYDYTKNDGNKVGQYIKLAEVVFGGGMGSKNTAAALQRDANYLTAEFGFDDYRIHLDLTFVAKDVQYVSAENPATTLSNKIHYIKGSTVAEPANIVDPTGQGRDIEGYYQDAACTKPWIFDGNEGATIIGSNALTKIYVKFKPNQLEINIDAESLTKVYDCKALTGNVTATYKGKAVSGVTYEYSIDGGKTWSKTQPSIIDAGSIENIMVRASKNGYKTSEPVAYTLTVTQRPVKVTTESANKVYDGEELTASGKIEGLVGTETVDFKVTGSQTEVGNSSNGYALAWTGTAKKSNYTVSEELGTLTVRAQSITPNTPDYTGATIDSNVPADVPYNGNEQKFVPTVTDGEGNILTEGDDYTVSYEGDTTNAGTVAVTVTGKGNYTGEVTYTYDITPAKIMISTESANKVYDGTEITAGGKVDGLVNGETVDFKTTGTQTEVGISDNTYALAWTGTAAESNYTITSVSLGKLQIKAQSIVPDTPNYTGAEIDTNIPENTVYNGNEQKFVPTVTDGEGNVLTEGTDYTVEYKGDTTNVGTITVEIAGKGNYEGTVSYDYQITPAPVKIKTESASKTYDGTALTATGEITGIVNGETVDFTTTGSQTEVGVSDNTYKLAWTGTAVESNYEIVEVSIGKLTVNEYEGTITVNVTGETVSYDGKEHGATVKVDGVPAGYTVEKAESAATATDATETAVKATCDTLVIKNAEGKDVTSELNIKYNDGEIMINPATLTVSTPDARKAYDGTALTADGSISGFVNGETADFDTTGTQTNVGSSRNTYEITWSGTAKKSNYKVVENFIGTLTVVPQSIDPDDPKPVDPVDPQDPDHPVYTGATIDSNVPADVPYNGNEQKFVPTVTDGQGNVLTEGDDYTVEYKGDTTNTGTVTVVITGKDNYGGTVEYTYDITPAEITISTESASKTYDGAALTAGGKVEGLVKNETVDFATTGTQTEAGISDNTYTLAWTGTAAESNYTITSVSLGKLTVNPQSIVPDTPTYTGAEIDTNVPEDTTYNGAEQKFVPTATDGEGNVLTEGDDYTVEYKGDTTNTGTITVVVTGKDNYEGSVEYTYDITPAPVKIRTASASKTYDGTALTATGEITGIVNGETVGFQVTGSQTEVGTSDNTYNLEWNGTAAESNYKVVEISIGKLTVNEYEGTITATTTGGTFTYTGDTHTATVKVDGVPAGYTVETAKSSATATDATETPVKATADQLVIKNAEGKDVTSELNIKFVDSEIVINPAELTISTPNARKVYDGKALTADGSIAGFVNGETAQFATTGTQTNVGSSKNTYEITWNGTAKKANYKVVENFIGTLTVVPQSIDPDDPKPTDPVDPQDPEHPVYTGATIDPNVPTDVIYNGGEQKFVPTVTDGEGNVLNEGDDYTIEYKGDTTNTGTVTVIVDGKGNYGGEVEYTYQIKPAEVKIITDSASKVYDGKALTAPGRVEGLVAGETADFATTGSQTHVGTSDNTYTFAWNGTAKESNYTIVSITVGKLTVTAQSIDPKDPDYNGVDVETPEDVIYNGGEQKQEIVVTDKDGNELVPGTDYEVHYPGNTTDAGEIVVEVIGKGDYDGKIDVSYKIVPAEVKIITDSASKVYDGTALTAPGRVEGLVAGETVDFAITGSQTETGTSTNTYALAWTGSAKKANYKVVSESLGTLTVTAPVPVPPVPVPPAPAPTVVPTDDATPTISTPTVEVETPAAVEPAQTTNINSNATPLANSEHGVSCWVHWWIIAGIILTAIYGIGVIIRRNNFIRKLQGVEDDVLDGGAQ